MARKCCVLSPVEAEDWQFNNLKPSCADHRHIPMAEARQMVSQGWTRATSSYFHPIARAIGPHHIVMIATYRWKVIDHCVLPKDIAQEMGIEGVLRVTSQQMVQSG